MSSFQLKVEQEMLFMLNIALISYQKRRRRLLSASFSHPVSERKDSMDTNFVAHVTFLVAFVSIFSSSLAVCSWPNQHLHIP